MENLISGMDYLARKEQKLECSRPSMHTVHVLWFRRLLGQHNCNQPCDSQNQCAELQYDVNRLLPAWPRPAGQNCSQGTVHDSAGSAKFEFELGSDLISLVMWSGISPSGSVLHQEGCFCAKNTVGYHEEENMIIPAISCRKGNSSHVEWWSTPVRHSSRFYALPQ